MISGAAPSPSRRVISSLLGDQVWTGIGLPRHDFQSREPCRIHAKVSKLLNRFFGIVKMRNPVARMDRSEDAGKPSPPPEPWCWIQPHLEPVSSPPRSNSACNCAHTGLALNRSNHQFESAAPTPSNSFLECDPIPSPHQFRYAGANEPESSRPLHLLA